MSGETRSVFFWFNVGSAECVVKTLEPAELPPAEVLMRNKRMVRRVVKLLHLAESHGIKKNTTKKVEVKDLKVCYWNNLNPPKSGAFDIIGG